MPARTSARIADDELLITRTFDAPLGVVWRMWASREHMIRWWGPEGFTVTDLDLDFRVGGAWRIGMTSAMFPKSWSSGRFTAIEPERRLAFSFAWEQGSGEDLATKTVEVTFEERDGRTTQHFHQAPFQTVESRDSHVGGWNSLFNKEAIYAAALAKGIQLDQLT
ncbi:SRPBCC family protein [Devosia sp. SL43]|uniref:SRPBCC family protein n=1 Tax=Devosia sp. SL43 TaxID=2806348 RepID=UPI001F48A266|nr:SRPBCC domain-containing protein [Devosia sp. SL43]UJW86815.1 SRPBCC domain-containing protein [Devosia sp. SL43]